MLRRCWFIRLYKMYCKHTSILYCILYDIAYVWYKLLINWKRNHFYIKKRLVSKVLQKANIVLNGIPSVFACQAFLYINKEIRTEKHCWSIVFPLHETLFKILQNPNIVPMVSSLNLTRFKVLQKSLVVSPCIFLSTDKT